MPTATPVANNTSGKSDLDLTSMMPTGQPDVATPIPATKPSFLQNIETGVGSAVKGVEDFFSKQPETIAEQDAASAAYDKKWGLDKPQPSDWEQLKTAVKAGWDNFNSAFDVFDTKKNPDALDMNVGSPAKVATNAIQAGNAATNIFFSLTGVPEAFAMAQSIPGLKPSMEIVNNVMSATGEPGKYALGKAADLLPIDDPVAKQNLKDAMEQAGSTMSQLVILGLATHSLANGKPVDQNVIDKAVDTAKKLPVTEVPSQPESIEIKGMLPTDNPDLPVEAPIKTTPTQDQAGAETRQIINDLQQGIITKEQALEQVKVQNDKFNVETPSPLAQEAIVKPEQISSAGRIKTSEIDNVYNKIPDGTISTNGYIKKIGDKLYPTEKSTPEILKNSGVALNKDGSISEGFGVNRISFTEDIGLNQAVKTAPDAKITEPVVVTPKTNELGTGETKTSKLSSDIADTIKKDLGDLPEYKTMDMKDQANKALDLYNKNPELFNDVAMGRKPAPEGIAEGSIFTAARKIAQDSHDIPKLMELAHSDLASETSVLGQRIKAFDDGTRDVNPVKKIQEVEKARGGKVTEAIKKSASKALKLDAWAEFQKLIEC